METKRKGSLFSKLIILTMIPLVIMGTILTLVSIKTLTSALKSEVKDGLQDVALSIYEHYNAIDSGDYSYDNGVFKKGNTILSEDYQYLDELSTTSDTYITICYGATRALNTIRDDYGERLLGSNIKSETAKIVLGGDIYFSDEIEINGKTYFGYYLPVKNSNGKVDTIIFTGKSEDFLVSTIREVITKILLIAFVILILCGISTFIFTKLTIAPLQKLDKIIELVSAGDLTTNVDNYIMERNDEIGNVAKSISKLIDGLKGIVIGIKNVSESVSTSANGLNEVTQNTSTTAEEKK
ncbi:MAG: hypothetical protein BV457_03395 [Thermoplasmata archaeon M9B1D]|nr:MAG: hypothetical protein BV457_03395 [Thermoplasmata archaeon M9B1D]